MLFDYMLAFLYTGGSSSQSMYVGLIALLRLCLS